MRTYNLYTTSTKDGEITSIYVSDMTSEEFDKELQYYDKYVNTTSEQLNYKGNDHYRPRLATFPVSQLYDKQSQYNKAKMLAEYMNKINEATEKAIRNTTLIDALSINPNP